MSQAFSKDTFAVVDLETTGTQKKQGDKIIQFGCVIIKNRKIVKKYSFLINPNKEIPLSVENLTGISNEEVKHAPEFSHYASKIREILKDTIFVAHNVNFDLPFLNYELENAGLKPLNLKAIDTVELAQIAFPTFPSYKLKDLTDRLHIEHLNPHQADSDAYVTGQLLLQIIEKLESLPQSTLNTLTSLSKGLVKNTADVFAEITKERRLQKRKLPKDLVQVKNLVLRRQTEQVGKEVSTKQTTFPESDDEKKALFKNIVRFRRGQVSLINRIHNFLSSSKEENMVVEAPNGSGKTLSFLMAYAYELYSGRKLVIATPTKVLQEQIMNQEIPQLLKITGLDLSAQEVKASSHYIDLDNFYASLLQKNWPLQTLILQMKIIIWLTETKTGDLDELQLTNFKDPLFEMIRHPGDARIGTTFSEYDFWNLARDKQEKADILVTNHAYLANHYLDSIWGQNPYLVVDEAHRFADNVANSRNDSLQFESFWGVANHLKNLLLFADKSVKNEFSQNKQVTFYLEKLEKEIDDLIHAINNIQRELYAQKDKALTKEYGNQERVNLGIQGYALFPNIANFKEKLNFLQGKIELVRRDVNNVESILYRNSASNQQIIDSLIIELQEEIDKIDYYSQQTFLLSDQLTDQSKFGEKGFVLQITNIEDPLSTNLQWLTLDPQAELLQLYQNFKKKLFISATLTQQGNYNYSLKELELDPSKTLLYSAKPSYPVEKHLQVLALDDEKAPQDPNEEEYTDFITDFLINDIKKQNHVLVLFTNLSTIKEVFAKINNAPELKDYEILAQGITGSNERLAKRFGIAKKSILLGANSFWEGMDFKDSGVDLVVATRLPFESPDQPEIKLRDERLKQQVGSHFFELDTLPRAIIRFRQGVGRLIRNEKDYGSFVILDQRFWHKNYGKNFLKSLPVGAKKVSRKELRKLLAERFKHESNS
ncbi:DEAD/DEAH box helicase [Lactobacillus sp. PV037]|uniref:helicase C-terminal domain-containing protein n=1 Tax=Lactobacillus sp. PV037 TaxID=2594496 RepID=UPI00223F708B|nr:helicase C-terminal domain-containing protein [Lactobacillus sp. PV037]QNQ83583.1 DEAD/DEAH box helicase [Lactobacillus sp. PV037]